MSGEVGLCTPSWFGHQWLTAAVNRVRFGGSLDVFRGPFCSRQRMGVKPKRVRRRQRIYSGFAPPAFLIAAAMDLAMMRAT
jgi:hypothetical protein